MAIAPAIFFVLIFSPVFGFCLGLDFWGIKVQIFGDLGKWGKSFFTGWKGFTNPVVENGVLVVSGEI